MAAFDPARGGTLTHGGTFNNNVVSMAGAAAAMSEMLSEATLSQLFTRGNRFVRDSMSCSQHRPCPVGNWCRVDDGCSHH